MEAEARAILNEVCGTDIPQIEVENLPRMIKELYGVSFPDNTVEQLIAERRREAGGEN
jgi:hypothetical protein